MAYRTTPKMAARKDARRRVLLEAATELFGKHGYHGTTVPMIVAEAGSSTGSFYVHFRNKEDVFAATLEALGERVSDVIEAAKRSERHPLDQIRAAVESLFVFLAGNREQARILLVESSGLSPELEQVRRSILARHANAVQHTIESHPGDFSVPDPAIASRCLVGAVFESLCSWMETPVRRRRAPQEAARAVSEYNLRALAATTARRRQSRLCAS